MGNNLSNNNPTTTSQKEVTNIHELDPYFSQSVVNAWVHKQLMDPKEYIQPLMTLYTNNQISTIAEDGTAISDEFNKVLLNGLDIHINALLSKNKNNLSLFTMPIIQAASGPCDISPLHIAFLQSQLPDTCRNKWKITFNSKYNGESFSQFIHSLVSAPSKTVIIINHSFGAFMGAPWYDNPGTFIGNSDNFLFDLKTTTTYKPSYYNENYAYLSINSKSFINGVGFGGQMDYFGIFLDANFTGKCFAKPISSTYNSPQFTKHEHFKVDHLMVAVVEELDKEDYLIKNPVYQQAFSKQENMEFLEMAGIQMHSKDL